MFAIGDDDWPGISKLVEECGEVLQVCGKLMGSGGEEAHWDGSNLRLRLEVELADMLAAAQFVIAHCNLNAGRIEARRVRKIEQFEAWHREPVNIPDSAIDQLPALDADPE